MGGEWYNEDIRHREKRKIRRGSRKQRKNFRMRWKKQQVQTVKEKDR